jgi:hypothetical protein
MSRLRTVVLGAAVWCAVVAAVAGVVWVVIERAGEGVLPETTPQADATGSLPVPGRDRAELHTSPGATLAPRPSRRTTSAGPSSAPSTAHTSPAAPAPAGPTPQRRSWNGAAGHVVAECQGSTGQLVSAFPGTGWRYTVVDRGPTLVTVRFQRLGEDHYVTVSAGCVTGAPRFSTSDGEPGDR